MYLPELSLLTSSIIWAYTFFVLKDLLEGNSVAAILCYRFIIASVALLPFVLKGKWNKEVIRKGVLCGTLFSILLVPLLNGLKDTSISNSGFIFSTYVLLVPLINFFLFGNKLKQREKVCVLTAFIGMVFVTGVSSIRQGDILAFIGALFASFHLLAIDRSMTKDEDSLVLTFIQTCTGSVIFFTCLLIFEGHLPSIRETDYLNFLFLGVIATALVTWLQCYGQKHVSAWKTCVIFATEPIFTALLAIYLIGEHLSFLGWIGGILIVSSIALSHGKAE